MANELFSSPEGREVYSLFLEAVEDNSMREPISRGVLVGLSGGADSVMLLRLLTEYRERVCGNFKIAAVHVNHGIRGSEAARDERFAEELAISLGVEFISRKVDVPTLAKACGKGIEEAARDARYAIFEDIISGRNDISVIALGHNATDNLETVIFNMMRGAGSRGIAGIPPTRDNIVRPMIYIPKSAITSALDTAGISYVTDSTNADTVYTRNYIRHEIIPALLKLTDFPEVSARRLSQNIRVDDDYINGVADSFLKEADGAPSAEKLSALHTAVLYRVITKMSLAIGAGSPERVHIEKIRRLLPQGAFSYDLPGGCRFISSCGVCRVVKRGEICDFSYPVSLGVNYMPEYSAELHLSGESAKTSHNVYKFSIQADLSSAIIEGGLYIRSRCEGDEYRYGGMTHKLKKMLIDAKIPRDLRDRVPVLADGRGVVWVPGFGVRDDGGTDPLYASLFYSESGFYVRKQQRHIKKKGANT